MGALTLAIPAEQRGRRLRLLLAYNLGRILSYACAGLLLGLAGWAVARTPLAGALRVVAGLLLIAMGLYLAGWWSGLTRVEALGRGLWRHLEPFARRLLPGLQPATSPAARRDLGLAALRAGLQHPALGHQPGVGAGQRAADAGVRPRHLAGAARHRHGRRTRDRPAAPSRRTHRGRPNGHSLRPLDPPWPAPGLADGTLTGTRPNIGRHILYTFTRLIQINRLSRRNP